MVMDPHFHDRYFSVDGFNFQPHDLTSDTKQPPNTENGFKFDEPGIDVDSFAVPLRSIGPDTVSNMPVISTDDPDRGLVFPAEPYGGALEPCMALGTSLNVGGENPSSSYVSKSSDPILRYIDQMLTEENVEEEVCISAEDLALQNTEKSLYDVLGEQYPYYLPDKFHKFDTSQLINRPDGHLYRSRIDPNRRHHHGEYNHTMTSYMHHLDQVPQLNTHCNSMRCASCTSNSNGEPSGFVESSIQVNTAFDDDYSVMQFMRGLEEASKFLPPISQLVVNFENVNSGSVYGKGIQMVDVHDNDSGNEDIPSGSRGRKNREREDLGLVEARATKQMASYMEAEEAELSDMFDKVLLSTDKAEPLSPTDSCLSMDANRSLQMCVAHHGSDGGRRKGRRHKKASSVDFRALLIVCAQALSSNDLRTANELLKQIRQNSSPSGNGSQRLAHYFANGLEARMAGNHYANQSIDASMASKRRSVADTLKAYQLYFSSCPFIRLSYSYMNHMIWKLSREATVLHIIHFGIRFGFQLPILIQKLGEQAGGSLKLRITAIELPHPGLRPEQTIKETCCRLALYCERFNVPFEYNVLPSRNWEAIKIEDLKIKSGEMIAVNCSMRFKYLLDETVEEDSPRDAVLNLIRRIKPDIFVHMVTNGSYNTPFFTTRFREALFYMSSVYDMLDTTISGEHKDSEERKILESEFYGWAIMNVIACEGPERIERPETYKQWQVRHERAGFKQLPLDRAMVEEIRHKLKTWYHEEFVLAEDGDWLLLGWKGRILNATTSWVPL